MKMNDHCLPCLINQTVKVAHMTKTDNKEELYRKVFQYLSTLDFEMTNPEIIGNVFQILKQHTGNNDPYKEVRKYYDVLKKKCCSLFFKRIFDIFVSLILLIIFSPLFLILAIAIKIDSKGPVFYRQVRVTQYGKQFKIHKFRSMVQDADKGSLVTVNNDARVTKVGKFIRKCRLDESVTAEPVGSEFLVRPGEIVTLKLHF